VTGDTIPTGVIVAEAQNHNALDAYAAGAADVRRIRSTEAIDPGMRRCPPFQTGARFNCPHTSFGSPDFCSMNRFVI
jgi:hypothetical protein